MLHGLRGRIRFARNSGVLALALGVIPINAFADDVFVCRDGQARITYVTVNTAHNGVKMVSGESPAHCIMVVADGAYGPVMSAPPGEFCAFTLGGQASVHQYARMRKDEIQFGIALGDDSRKDIVLNTETGLMESSDGTEECHRAHS